MNLSIYNKEELLGSETMNSGDQESINQGQVSELLLDGADLKILPTA